MNLLIAITFAMCCCCVVAQADTVATTTKTVIPNVTTETAQQDADEMARTGILQHRGNCGCLEGVGMADTRERAIARCCYWGSHEVIDIGVAKGRCGRWFACVRYKTELKLSFFRPRRSRSR
jgi:hypothetical protein